MKAAIVAPTKFLDKYCNTGLQLCYVDLVLENSAYKSFYAERAIAGDIVILDHSPRLPRKPVDLQRFRFAFDLVKPTYVTLPDFEFSCDKTLFSISEVVEDYRRMKCGIIGVLQGYDLEQVRKCYEGLRGVCDVVALPNSSERVCARYELAEELEVEEPIIYLEVDKDPIEEIPLNSNGVIGIATSWPLRLAYRLRNLYECRPVPLPLNFHMKREPDPELAAENVTLYLKLVEESEK